MVAVGALMMVVVVVALAVVCEASDSGDEMTTSDVAGVVLEQIQSHLTSASYSLQGRMYGSCTDSFSIFGFLAFLLALLDLVMELQNMDETTAETERRRREVMGKAQNQVTDLTCQDLEMQEAASASYSLLRGFLNALTAQDQECANKFVCEGAEEAAAAGPLGEVVARVASLNAASWLLKVNSTLFAGTEEAGQAGARKGGCALRFSQCLVVPPAYRSPGVSRDEALPALTYQSVLEEIMNVASLTLL
ncbi:uncharacterized protein LOC123499706 [Portunus trituberculatus]|uniref:Uncharacterized protein n=1 Tax=Portunus trituberculatus TaxID=210409 RepID=A0A5B7D6B7_PORTR|nr:uncharacterized protein LOC123499706 [Portunus trituberculatus]MPC16822.1 hypothetical protein [Portunus trituberculatus]